MTIWEAVEEAIRWWTTDRLTMPGELPEGAFTELPWGDDSDPLRTSVQRLLASTSEAGGADGLELEVILTPALDAWVRRLADLYNDGHRFAHPAPRHGWPSPSYDAELRLRAEAVSGETITRDDVNGRGPPPHP